MNAEMLERLLYEEESDTLDFKLEQYPFSKATDEQKSELLKDILGFANAWRRADAYILIGVEDIRGGRSKIVGIPDDQHLHDHSLQQFVNSLTNRPIRFNYKAFGIDGKQLGVIHIEQQKRPIFLKRDFGKLKKDLVYVRRGSSTSPSTPADPDEVASMGSSLQQQATQLRVVFCNNDTSLFLGDSITLETQRCVVPNKDEIPDAENPKILNNLGFSFPDLMSSINRSYYRELADYISVVRMFRPICVGIENIGDYTATNVRTELTIPTGALKFLDELEDKPEKYHNSIYQSIRNIPAFFKDSEGSISVDRNNERVKVEINFGNLQPGRKMRSDVFYIGAYESGSHSLLGVIYADNARPQDYSLNIDLETMQIEVTLEQLLSFQAEDEEGYT